MQSSFEKLKFAFKMKRPVFILSILLLFGINYRISAQSLKDIITNGNWHISKPLDSLHITDSLVIALKQMTFFSDRYWVQFGNDSALKQRQTYHFCQSSKKGRYTMRLGYRWNERGSWVIFYDNLELKFGNRTLDLMTRRLETTNVKFVIASVTNQ
jgi:hypothetical protein